jgi:MFS family permease
MTDKATPKHQVGMAAFTVVWLGQIVSVLASNMSHFGLTIWVFQKTDSATILGVMNFFFLVPFLALSPFAGVMVDRYNRKLMMMVSDLGAVLATFAILILQALGLLETWHLYVTSALYGLSGTFQWPAYSAAISTMVPKEQLGRANGMMSLLDSGPSILAPILAGALLPLIGLTGILVVDVVTFFIAIGALLVVHVPQPERTAAGEEGRGGMLKEAAYGFRYIFARPSLIGLLLLFLLINVFLNANSVFPPMVLLRTGNDSVALGSVQSAGAIGATIGGVIMSAWGGFKRRIHGVLIGCTLVGLFGFVLIGMGRGLPVWIPANLVRWMILPLATASSQAIWQAKVAPDVQGRVFATRRLIAWFSDPLVPLAAGALADYVLEPGMRAEGALAAVFGGLVGTGPGTGMALLLILSGIGMGLVSLAGYLIPVIREVEHILPDHDQAVGEET